MNRAGGQLHVRGKQHILRRGEQHIILYALHVEQPVPNLGGEELARRFAQMPAKLSVGNRLRRVLGDPLRAALLMEWGQPLPNEPERLAMRVKSLRLRHQGPFGIARAISSAGGITADSLTRALELRALPGVFAAGEMLDWEAPTGGYLLTGCLATGRRAGIGAAAYLASAR